MKHLLIRYRNTPIEARASFWYMICNLLQKGITFIIIPIYTRVLTTNEYGHYAVFQSWRDIIVIFATLNLSSGVFTRGLVRYKEDRDQYISSMQGLSSTVTIVVYLLYFLFSNQFAALFQLKKEILSVMFLYYIFNPAILFWSVRQRVENKYTKMITITMLLSIATPIVSLIMLLFTNLREEALIYGSLLIQTLVGAVFYFYHFFKGRLLFSRKYWSESLKFNIPLIPHYLSLIVLGQSDRIMIDRMCGSSEAGIYSLTSSISQTMNIFIGAVNGAIVPWTYNQLEEKNYNIIRKVSNIICMLMCLIALMIIAVAPEIVLLLGGKQYMEAVWCIPPIVLGVYLSFCYGLFSTIEFYVGVTKYIALASVTGALLNIILNAMFIPVFGYIAAGYTTFTCYLLFATMHYLFMKKVFSNSIYNMKSMVTQSIFLCIAAFVFIMLYRIQSIRYGLLTVAMIAIYINRKVFIDTITRLKRGLS